MFESFIYLIATKNCDFCSFDGHWLPNFSFFRCSDKNRYAAKLHTPIFCFSLFFHWIEIDKRWIKMIWEAIKSETMTGDWTKNYWLQTLISNKMKRKYIWAIKNMNKFPREWCMIWLWLISILSIYDLHNNLRPIKCFDNLKYWFSNRLNRWFGEISQKEKY